MTFGENLQNGFEVLLVKDKYVKINFTYIILHNLI